jgi:Domain of unknown function (DUF4118)
MEIDRVTTKDPNLGSVITSLGANAVLAKDQSALPTKTQAFQENQAPGLNEAATKITPNPAGGESNLSITDVLLPIPDPFVGMVGRSFLHFCQAVELVTGWIKPRPAPAELAAESLLNSNGSAWKHWGASSLGVVCCTVAAALLIPLFGASSGKAFLPIPFLLIIVLVALGFGRAAGVLGTLGAAFLFAWFLYEPAGLAVADPVAKSHLIWMLIIGVLLSDLLARFRMRLPAVSAAKRHAGH